jgi:hypothetical protein
LVLEHARRALPAWEQRIRAGGLRPALPNAPLLALLVITPLLALKPAASPSRLPAPQANASTAVTAPRASLQALVAELRKASATDAQRAPRPALRSDRTAGPASMPAPSVPSAADDPKAERAAIGAVEPRPQRSGQGHSGRENAQGASAGTPGAAGTGGPGKDVAGAGSAHSTQPSADIAVEATQRPIPLMRRGTATGVGGPGGALEQAAAPEASGSVGIAAPPATLAPQAPGTRLLFSPAQRRLIAGYFALLEEEADR